MPRLHLDIDQTTWDALVQLGTEFRRPPQMQAEWMLMEIVREAMASYRATQRSGPEEACGP